MPRIRSIKPEFFTDAKIASLSKSTALFFIGLWTIASDQGVFPLDSRALSLLLPSYRSQGIKLALSCLFEKGLIKTSKDAQSGLIVGWQHQKIDKPRAGKINPNDVEWLTWSDSENGRDESPTPRRKDRIKDRIREDLDLVLAQRLETSAASPEKSKSKLAKEKTERNRKAREAFITAYRTRYSNDPIIDTAFNSIVSKIVDKVGPDDAALVLEFYVNHPSTFYVEKGHAVKFCLSDIDSLLLQARKGVALTRSKLRVYEQLNDRVEYTTDQMGKILGIDQELKQLEAPDEDLA